MSESTDLYYDRLASVATNAMTTAPEDAHPINIMTHAVAAQVLRDVVALFTENTFLDEDSIHLVVEIEEFAKERGISLEDTP